MNSEQLDPNPLRSDAEKQKVNKKNPSASGLCPSSVDLPRSGQERELLLLKRKST
jgi:hypothetical protein